MIWGTREASPLGPAVTLGLPSKHRLCAHADRSTLHPLELEPGWPTLEAEGRGGGLLNHSMCTPLVHGPPASQGLPGVTWSLGACLSPPPHPAVHLPREKISQSSTPKDHTSLCVVYTLSKMLSGAIHFRGSRAWGRQRETYTHGGREEREKAKHLGSPSLAPSLPRTPEPHPKKGFGPFPPL